MNVRTCHSNFTSLIKLSRTKGDESFCFLHAFNKEIMKRNGNRMCAINQDPFASPSSIPTARRRDDSAFTSSMTSVQRRFVAIDFFSDEVPLSFVLRFCDELFSIFADCTVLNRMSASKLSWYTTPYPSSMSETLSASRTPLPYHHRF